MRSRDTLTATGAVNIEHKISRVISSIEKARATIDHHAQFLRDDQAARLEDTRKLLSAALRCAEASRLAFKLERPLLRPMDAVEQRVIEELVASGVILNLDR